MKLPSLRRRWRTLAGGLALALAGGLGVGALTPAVASADASGAAGPASVTVTPTTGLVNNQAVSISASTASAPGTPGFFQASAHICIPGAGISDNTSFQQSGPNCVASPLSGGTDAAVDVAGNGTQTSINATFHPGIGSTTWTDTTPLNTGSHTLQCDSTHPCDLVVRYQINTAGSPFFFTAPLTFFGTPGAPTGVAATPGNGQATVSWSAPANTGNGTINQYTVTTTGPGAPGPVNVAGNVLSTQITGLQNFQSYSFTVHARAVASDNTTTATSAESSPAATASPQPTGPQITSALPGNNQVTLTWTPPTFTTGLTGYSIVYTDTTHPGPPVTVPVGNVTTSIVTGLNNGDVYSFTVAAVYGPGQQSLASAPVSVSASGTFITQHIDVTRPASALVLTQACSSLPTDEAGHFDPTNSVPTANIGNQPNPNVATDCTVHLSGPRAPGAHTVNRTVTDGVTDGTTHIVSATAAFTTSGVGSLIFGDNLPPNTTVVSVQDASHATLSAAALATATGNSWTIAPDAPTPARLITTGPQAGQFFAASGDLQEVTIVDIRDNDPGWTATGSLGQFTDALSHHFSASDVGWTPTVHDHSAPFTSPDGNYTQIVNAGGLVAPLTVPGLGANPGPSLAVAPARAGAAPNLSGGLGIAHLDAHLDIRIPVFANAGTYTAVMTFTVA
jgi:hypothetical protein